MITIAKDRIGKFTSLAEKRTYDRAISIKSAAETAAKKMQGFDESPQDLNSASYGHVLLDRADLDSITSLSGYCQFDPHDGEIQKLDYKRQSVFESVMTEETVRMEQKSDGTTFYQSKDGSLTVDAKGNLMFDPKAGLPSWS
jgi:hypothetical protein